MELPSKLAKHSKQFTVFNDTNYRFFLVCDVAHAPVCVLMNRQLGRLASRCANRTAPRNLNTPSATRNVARVAQAKLFDKSHERNHICSPSSVFVRGLAGLSKRDSLSSQTVWAAPSTDALVNTAGSGTFRTRVELSKSSPCCHHAVVLSDQGHLVRCSRPVLAHCVESRACHLDGAWSALYGTLTSTAACTRPQPAADAASCTVAPTPLC